MSESYVRYKLVADSKNLRTKYKKDASKIIQAFSFVSTEQIENFIKNNTIEILGFLSLTMK